MRSLELGWIRASVGAEPCGTVPERRTVRRVSTDSRDIRPGDLFWALAGERFDGHDFVPRALEAGAVAAVVRRPYPGAGPFVRVADTRHALAQFAAWYRALHPLQVVGITGSVGKTSAREAIYGVLGTRWAGVRSRRNFNNDVGVPLSLLDVEPCHEFAVIELGASAPGEIARLAAVARPQVGVLTAIGPAHLEGFGSLDGVARAKGELIAALEPAGTAVLNADDPRVCAIGDGAACRVAWFGLGTERSPGVRADDLELSGRTVSFRWDGGPRTTLRAAGRHQVYAALAAIAVGRLFGMDDREIRAGLERYEAPPMRCQVERLGGVTLINDAYNSNPLSARAALDLLCGWPATGRRVLVCGDMKELGDRAQEYHEQLGQEIARRGCIDRLVAVGPLSRYVADGALREGMAGAGIDCCDSADEAAQLVKTVLRDGDVVLLKGSRAIGLEQTAERLRETARLGRAA